MNKYDKAMVKLIEIFNSMKLGIEVSAKEFIVCTDTIQELVDKEKPLEIDHTSDGYPDGYYLLYDIAFCPNCDRAFEVTYNEHYKYCPSCGQRLNWGDKDE